MLTREQATKRGIPPAFRDRYIIRCIDKRFGPSSKDNPMIVLNWEIAGVPKGDSVDTKLTRGGVDWDVVGLQTQPSYFTLIPGPALDRFFDFQEKAGLPADEIDDENPDLTGYDGLLMEAIVTGSEQVERKALTPEERAEGKTVGDPILDGDGNEIKRTQLQVQSFLKKWQGEVPTPY